MLPIVVALWRYTRLPQEYGSSNWIWNSLPLNLDLIWEPKGTGQVTVLKDMSKKHKQRIVILHYSLLQLPVITLEKSGECRAMYSLCSLACLIRICPWVEFHTHYSQVNVKLSSTLLPRKYYLTIDDYWLLSMCNILEPGFNAVSKILLGEVS